MPNQYDNINKDYLTYMIKCRMEEFGYTNDSKMFDRIYKRICKPNTEQMRLIIPSFEPSTEKYVTTDEDKIVSLASGDYDCGMEMDAYIMWAMEVK